MAHATRLKEPEMTKRSSGGRPTRAEAAERDARVVEAAARLFIERGFDATSIDAVAEVAGVGKPTLYARYGDKRTLFEAVIRERIHASHDAVFGAIEQRISADGQRDLEEVLTELSRVLLVHVHDASSAALTRCLAAQALQFPDLARMAFEEGWTMSVQAVSRLLTPFVQSGQVVGGDPNVMADMFLSLVLGRGSRQALSGIAVNQTALEERRAAAVALFLRGVRPTGR